MQPVLRRVGDLRTAELSKTGDVNVQGRDIYGKKGQRYIEEQNTGKLKASNSFG